MRTAKQSMIDKIIEKLSWLKSYVEINNTINLTDINICSEDFFADLLNLIYGYDLKNLNALQKNYSGIDLGDIKNRVCVQVTSNKTNNKIIQTIELFDKNKYCEEYDRLIILIIGNKKNYSTNFVSQTINFDKKKDIIDMDTIIDNINKSPKTTIKKIYEYIVSNIVTSDCYDIILSSKTDYLLQQQKKIYAICLSKLRAIGLDDKIARIIIDDSEYDKMLLRQDGVHYLVGGFGSGKSHTLYLLALDLIKQYLEDKNSKYPIFVQATDLEKFTKIEEYVKSQNQDLNDCFLIMDGLDEVEYFKVEKIISEIDYLNAYYTNFNAIISSREMSCIDRDKIIAIKALSTQQINDICCKVNNRPPRKLKLFINIDNGTKFKDRIFTHICKAKNQFARKSNIKSFNIEYIFHNNEQILKSLSKPFFAVIFALYYQKNDMRFNSDMDMINLFIKKSLNSYVQKYPSIFEDLAQLSVLSLNRNLGSVHKSEIEMNINDIEKLLKSGFISSDGQDNYSFTLPIVAQWLGAYAITNNLITIDKIISSIIMLLKWIYSLSILLNQTSYNKSVVYFTKIIYKYPGIAFKIVKNSSSLLLNKSLPNAYICGKQLYDCMQTWLRSLQWTNFLSDGIHNNTVGILNFDTGSQITYGWANAYLGEEVKVYNPTDFQNQYAAYSLLCTRNVSAQDTWSWLISLDYLSIKINQIIKGQQIVPPNSKIEQEFLWKCGLLLLNKSSLCQREINIKEFDKYRRFLEVKNIYFHNVCLNDFFEILDRYVISNGEYLKPPYPLGDQEINIGYIWDYYSKEKMLERIKFIYVSALNEYKSLVENYFPTIKNQLSTYLNLPGIIKGNLIWNNRYESPCLSWYIVRLSSDQQNDCEINYSETDNILFDESIRESIRNKVLENQPENIYFMNYVVHGECCYDGSETPITDLVYRFLKDDLKYIGLIE